MSGMTSAAEAKKAARSRVRTRRRDRRDAPDAITARERAAAGISDRTVELVDRLSLPVGTVAAYEAFSTEPPTGRVMDTFAERGWRVIVPITRPDSTLSWRERGSDVDLGRPLIGQVTLLLVPALSVGRDGTRLGQGGGYYDRCVPQRADGTPVAAIVWDDEFVDSVPADDHDVKVDAVITPQRIVIPDQT